MLTLHYCNTTQPLVSGATAWLMKNQDNAAIAVNAVIADHCKVCDTALLQYNPTFGIGCNCMVDEKSR